MKKPFIPAPRIPGYAPCEYLLVIRPHEDLCHRIQELRKEFAAACDRTETVSGTPNITLVKFTQYEVAEPRVMNRIRMIAMGLPAFKIDLANFGSLPSHTIYFEITNKATVTGLVKPFKQVQQLLTLNKDHKPFFNADPFIALGRQLLPWQYEKGWLEYSNRHFSASFIARELLLLKRPEGLKAYSPCNRFPLMNLPVVTKQGQLFYE